MFWLIFGNLLWADVHLFKRVLPDMRAKLNERLGEKGAKGLVTLLLVISLIMMIQGFRQMGWDMLYHPPAWLRGIGSIFAFLGLLFFGAAHSKSRVRGLVRHPMLTGVVLWSVGHYMITGLTSGFILFTGMLIWAVTEIRLINRQEPDYTPYRDGTLKGDIRLIIITIIITAIVIAAHFWLLGRFK